MIRLAPGDPTDRGSEYGRLLAQRDRLVSQGVDPAEKEKTWQSAHLLELLSR